MISGDLPPNIHIAAHRGIWRVENGSGEVLVGDCRSYEKAKLVSWLWFQRTTGFSRRAYAEMVAPQRVREAAEAKYGDSAEVQICFGRRVYISARSRVAHGFPDEIWSDPDICTAALAVIQKIQDMENKKD